MLDDGLPLLLVFVGRNSVGASNRRIDGPDQRGTIQLDHLVDQLHQIFKAGLLLFGRPAQIPIGPHASAHRTARETVLFQFFAYVARLDVFGRFNRYFHRIKPPFFELPKQLRALVGKWGSKKERVDPKSHILNEANASMLGVKRKCLAARIWLAIAWRFAEMQLLWRRKIKA